MEGSTGPTATVTQTPVPLSALTHFKTLSEPVSIGRQGQFPAVTISFNLAPGYSLGQALNAINDVVAKAKMPASIIASYRGGCDERAAHRAAAHHPIRRSSRSSWAS